MAAVFVAQEDHDAALEMFVKELAITTSALGDDHPRVGATYHAMASVYEAKGDSDSALELYQTVLAIRRATLGDGHPDVGETYHKLALLHHSKGDHETAQKYRQAWAWTSPRSAGQSSEDGSPQQ